MKIALIGYGKMGKEIEKIAISRYHNIVLRVNELNADTITLEDLQRADVAIEFSTPFTVVKNIYKCFEANLPIVVGTTGWNSEFEAVKNTCIENKKSLFYTSNFSLGVNLFFELNTKLAQLMNKQDEYKVEIEEIHHIHKKDKPSGTAITLANGIIENLDRKKNWSLEKKTDPESLYIKDVRQGEVPGTHVVTYESTVDKIEIKHEAYNRSGFATGAVLSAEFLLGRKGIFGMKDLLSL